jgi:hypothetical protein
MGNPANLRLAPAIVRLDGTDLGYTSYDNAIEVADTSKGIELKAAQEGDTAVDIILSGHGCTVKVPLAEVTPEKLAMAIPNSTLVGGLVTIKNRPGLSLRSLAKPLTVTRIIGGVESTDPNDILTFGEVTPMPGTVTQIFDAKKQQELLLTLVAWPDPTTKNFYTVGA